MPLCSPGNCSGDGFVNVLACPGGFYLFYLCSTTKSYVTSHRACGSFSCGVNAQCGWSGGCVCRPGYEIPAGFLPTTDSYGCADVDECTDSLNICGNDGFSLCTNTPGGFQCDCKDGHITVPPLGWDVDISLCKAFDTVKQCTTVFTLLSGLMDFLDQMTQTLGSGLLVEYGDAVLQAIEKLVSMLVNPSSYSDSRNVTTKLIDVKIVSIAPNVTSRNISQISAGDVLLDIDLLGIANNNNGSASVALVSFTNMENILSPSLFHTDDSTAKTMVSNVVSVLLPKTSNKRLSDPVNITFLHKMAARAGGQLWCVYWNYTAWIVDGCSITSNTSTQTVCSCVHLSTFALIMQTGKPSRTDLTVDELNMIVTPVGLVFLALAVLTFALCRWNAVVNTARLNLCVCLLLAHLLFLLVQSFLSLIHPHKVLCQVLAGVLHFLYLCSFAWMNLEAALLFFLVRKLNRLRVFQAERLHWGYMYLVAYGFPLIVVGVSAAVMPDGYGNEQCWLKTEKGFRWSFLGPVTFILACNTVLFMAIFISFYSTLTRAQNDISQITQTRTLMLKSMVQFIILGCPWILGFFEMKDMALKVIFIVFNSQQGTFIFLVHCVLNEGVRQQYRRWWRKITSSHAVSVKNTTSTLYSSTK
ncbi:adhesion G protein-coupled receptor E2-like [Denticeps clupeoides]|uniref:adhesion G protein-coupled receptor E2-like n=1 Tax=Denticeps clupeoides TaxID=299321 RepID=UPI0010A44ED0|nr:adhesion G protein-coupled receptor E2-like [Denticeps clupeoides]